jgi:F-type H+-transporting ATPase subunit delta
VAKPTKRQIAEAVFALSGKASQAKLAKVLAAYLVAERRSGELDAIMRELKTIRERTNGTQEVTITTAFPATDKVKKQLKGLLSNDKVIMNEVIDKNVIGGVRMEANDYYLDLTVRNRLNKLKIGATK